MKNYSLKFSSLILALFLTFNTNAGINKLKFDSLSCLQVEGKILNAELGTAEECLVELISNNEILEGIVLKEGKNKFKFVLSKNTFYSIRVSKVGFVPKLISVNTEMLVESEGIHVFSFETSLISEVVGTKLNQDVIDFPVTIIQFDYEMDCFVHNAAYTAYIKKELFKRNSTKAKHLETVYTLETNDLASNRDSN
jgi:hypothetical protein